ncbi:ABC transporter substrate-binding protein [Streptomyces abyssalis]|uniref:ABC transporter substrate-binding protein n=1 Tax=Streptomyces abyssalis TaxID=933944 RepID=A0A1E7JKI0_9ACTN|nr:extracellular solute-binding protein [Streptomyces abyssalis]OEU88129.1 ABC transporter substrate-binding protein [Streptomyces abyssalis]OEU91000.1 ABC transporter substrate-binding protein [Streptomyces abyssalis]
MSSRLSAGPPKPAMSRRALLRGAAAAGSAGVLAGCAGRPDAHLDADAAPWKRYAGTTLNFISENTAPTAAIAADLRPFTELTGIRVNIVTLELSALAQKVALDFASGNGEYDVVYADPYLVLAPYAAAFADLREFQEDPALPRLPGGFGDFIPAHLDTAGRFGDSGKVLALPYDCPTMVWQYRADLFEEYGERMADDLGFDPTPSDNSTWEQYHAIAKWFNSHAHQVRYGTGHQAKQHDALMCDFSNVLWSYDGSYFADGTRVGRFGTTDPGKCLLRSDAAVAGAEFYDRLLRVADPASRTWDWDGLGAAFRSGRIAMCPNWHEYAAANETALPGKVGYARLPKGPARSAGMYGGTGIAVSNVVSARRRRAAWLFANWATAPKTQVSNLASKVGGGTPTRASVYAVPRVVEAEQRPSKMPNMLTAEAVKAAWKDANLGLRPKIPMWGECDTAIYTELSRMFAGEVSPGGAMRAAADRIDRITARGWVN